MIDDLSNKKILIFSDTHLKCKFDKKWFDKIKSLIMEADKIIINGDFWENISCPFDKFIKTEYREKLFPLLKNKTILIHGNHDSDKYIKNNEDLKLFSLENYNYYEFKSGDKIFHLRHGHILTKNFKSWRNDIILFLKYRIKWLYFFIKKREGYFSWFLNKIGLKVINIFKKFSLKNYHKNKIFIFGHIHLPKHNLDDNFLVLGSFKSGEARYIFIDNGKVEFHNEKY